MKTNAEAPYRAVMTLAATVAQLPTETRERDLRALARELAAAVADLDARMRAGLTPPRAWQAHPRQAGEPTGRAPTSVRPDLAAPAKTSRPGGRPSRDQATVDTSPALLSLDTTALAHFQERSAVRSSRSLADRAAMALRRVHDSNTATENPAPARERHRGRLARLAACLLGSDPADVVVSDDGERDYGGYPGFLITVYDGDTVYRFAPDVGDDSLLHLLRACPSCGRQVYAAAITSLSDLGRTLGSAADLDAAFADDPAHTEGCPSQHTDHNHNPIR